jgi:hypothetical protein
MAAKKKINGDLMTTEEMQSPMTVAGVDVSVS